MFKAFYRDEAFQGWTESKLVGQKDVGKLIARIQDTVLPADSPNREYKIMEIVKRDVCIVLPGARDDAYVPLDNFHDFVLPCWDCPQVEPCPGFWR